MKKLSTIIILLLIFCTVLFFETNKKETHKVLKVISPTEFYVDFNDNQSADTDELVELLHIDTEPENLSKTEQMELIYLGTNFAKDKILNKDILVKRNDKTKIILANQEDYETILKQKGFVLTKENIKIVKENLMLAKTLNLVSYNKQSHKYHKLDCKYAFNSPNVEITKLKDLPKNAIPCKNCIISTKPKKNKTSQKNTHNYPKDIFEKYTPIYKDNYLEFYITDFTKYYYPSSKCLTTACKSLLKEINNSKFSIDFAIYGIDKQPEITKALLNAQKRGVKIRWVYDTDKNGNTIYSETNTLKNILKNSKRDIDCAQKATNETFKDAIMHNKFFIFDNQKVWSGSANISNTDLSGFNANSVILINSPTIANIYKNEFEQMYFGKFHNLKTKTPSNTALLGISKISVYFSPQDKIISSQVIPILDKASQYIYVPVFVITHKDFNQALIRAKQRGVDIKIIVDATSAGSQYSSVKYLRANGINVKTENRAGKMHMKSILIDDKYSIIGSMNFTKSGERYNDENVLIIENTKLTQAFKKSFMHFWNAIPDKWLYRNPAAESFSSINSCFDGIDNDFDGKIDMQDDSCNFKKVNNK